MSEETRLRQISNRDARAAKRAAAAARKREEMERKRKERDEKLKLVLLCFYWLIRFIDYRSCMLMPIGL